MNVLDEILSKVDALTVDVRALKGRAVSDRPSDDLGGLDLAVEITGLARRTLYKLTHRRAIPHRRVGGRLYFRRSELEQWIDAGRRATAAEVAEDRMIGKNEKAQRA